MITKALCEVQEKKKKISMAAAWTVKRGPVEGEGQGGTCREGIQKQPNEKRKELSGSIIHENGRGGKVLTLSSAESTREGKNAKRFSFGSAERDNSVSSKTQSTGWEKRWNATADQKDSGK